MPHVYELFVLLEGFFIEAEKILLNVTQKDSKKFKNPSRQTESKDLLGLQSLK
jgi:hypothetical protein